MRLSMEKTLDRVGEICDALVYAVAPGWGAQRKAIRHSYERFSAIYHEGASKDRLHDGKWLGSRISPDSALEQDGEVLRSRSHELYRSDSLGGMVDMMVDHIVSQGFTYNSKIKAVSGISDSAAEGFNADIESVMDRWSKTVDISRLESWWETTRLMTRHLLFDGEAFLVFWNSRDRDVPIPLFLEVVDPERVETPPDHFGDPNCRMGIQYDQEGRILGYHIRTNHPYDTKKVEIKYQFIPKDRCYHLLERWFTNQSRGYNWMTRIINDARDGKDIREAGLVTAQTQACLSVFIKGAANPLAAAAGRSTGTDSSGRRLQSVEPGSVNYLGDNEEPLFLAPTGMNHLAELLVMNDRRIAAGMNMPYEFIARNWSGVSFAGGRLVLNEAKMTAGVKQKLIATRALIPTANEAVKQAIIVGAVDINPSAFNRRPWVYQRPAITPPLWSYAITPGEEVNALRTAVDANFISQEAAAAQYSGADLDELIPQRGKELEAQRKANCLPLAERESEAQAKAIAQHSPQAKEMANHA